MGADKYFETCDRVDRIWADIDEAIQKLEYSHWVLDLQRSV